jgi:hypothetical protein
MHMRPAQASAQIRSPDPLVPVEAAGVTVAD